MAFLEEIIAAVATAAMPAPSSDNDSEKPRRKERNPIVTLIFLIMALLIVFAGFTFLAFV